MAALYYKDEHTGKEHYCGSGGSNVPALNRLLAPFGFGLRSRVYAGRYSIHGRQVEHAAGSAIAKAPAGSLVYEVPLYEISAEITMAIADEERPLRAISRNASLETVGVVGFHRLSKPSDRRTTSAAELVDPGSSGWLLVLTDSSCLDDSLLGYSTSSPMRAGRAGRRMHCRFLLTEVLAAALRPQRTSSEAEIRPPVLSQARLLREPIDYQRRRSSLAGTSNLLTDGLSPEQARAFRSQSRVWAIMSGCRSTEDTCALPVVSRPRWIPAQPMITRLAAVGAQTDDGATASTSPSAALRIALVLNALAAFACLALIGYRLIRPACCHGRQTRRRGAAHGDTRRV